MGRILFWLLLGVGAYFVWRWLRIKQRVGSEPATPSRTIAGESMVRCEICGLNVPRSEAVEAGGRWFCSDEHRRRVSG